MHEDSFIVKKNINLQSNQNLDKNNEINNRNRPTGCEVWGLFTNHPFTKQNTQPLETLQEEFCKTILQCKYLNNACRAELEQYPQMDFDLEIPCPPK